jgi:hypothetical protein
MGLSGFSGKVSNSFCIKEIFSGVRIVTRSKSPPCGALVWLRDQFWCQETVQKQQLSEKSAGFTGQLQRRAPPDIMIIEKSTIGLPAAGLDRSKMPRDLSCP